MDLNKNFGKNLQKYRKYRGLTQEKLAELIGVDVTSISSIETGKYFPSADNLSKLAMVLQIRLNDLFEFDSMNTEEEMYKDILNIIDSFKNDKKRLNSIRVFLKSLI